MHNGSRDFPAIPHGILQSGNVTDINVIHRVPFLQKMLELPVVKVTR